MSADALAGFGYSRGSGIHDNRPHQFEVGDFDGFVAALDADRAPTKAGAAYICGPLNGDGRRHAEGAMPRRWIAVDLDRIAPDVWPELRLWFAGRFRGSAWPTHSSKPDAPRERVLIELGRAATRTECIEVGRVIAADLADEFGAAVLVDPSTFRGEQPVFLPPVGVEFARFLGDPLDVDKYLQAAAALPAEPSRIDPETGEIRAGKVTEGGRHAHLVRTASRMNWAGLSPEALRAALQAENLASCDPPKTDAEVSAIAADIQRRYSGQHGRDQHSTGEDAERRRERQRKQAQDIGDGIDGQAPLTEIMDLHQMLQRLVFVGDGSRVAQRDRPHIALPLSEFKLQTRASETRVGRKLVPTADLWVADPMRISAHTITFRPGHPEFTVDPEGAPALNLWSQRVRPANTASVAPLLEHVAYLVPDEDERGRFLDWLAHIEQFPGVLPHTHYLMVAQQTGIGRNWLASLLARVWTGSTRLGFDLVGAMQSGFNGALSRRLLVIVDELKAADTGYGAANHAQQLKAMLTTEHRAINPKFGRQHIEFNCARWLMLSQHYDALPLERADRRVLVVTNPGERRTADYYARLYQLLDDAPFIQAVGYWLAQRDIAGFNPSEPAPLTASKKMAIDACIGDLERALIDLRNGTDALVLRSTQIIEYLQDCGLRPPAGRAMGAAYAAAGLVPCDCLVRLHGKRHRVVALRDTERLKSAPAQVLLDLMDPL